MAAWALIPMAIKLGADIFGGMQGAEAAEKGAKANAKIERANREYQNKVFTENMEKLKPFVEAGRAAIPKYDEAIKGRGEPMNSGLAQMQKKMIEADTGSMTDHVKKITMQRLEAGEAEKNKARLMDLQQIGLGSAGTAGRSSVNTGSTLASSYARAGERTSNAALDRTVANQNMWMQSLDAISGLPAYYASMKDDKKTSAPSGYGSRQGYVGGVQQNGGPMYA